MQALMETELTRRILRSVPILAHLTEGDRDKVPRLRQAAHPTQPRPGLALALPAAALSLSLVMYPP